MIRRDELRRQVRAALRRIELRRQLPHCVVHVPSRAVARCALYAAAAHVTGHDESGLLDMDWWRLQPHVDWGPFLDQLPNQPDEALRACTHAGRPFGSEDFLRQTVDQFDRHWTRGRPKKKPPARPRADSTEQLSL